jgi:hypothetical protein
MSASLRGRAPRVLRGAVAGLAASLLVAGASHAGVTVYQGNLAAFNASTHNPAIMVDFDNPALGDITDSSLNGIFFSSPDDNQLVVLDAASTFPTPGFGGPGNSLQATSGARILSPGGPELFPGGALPQKDSIQFTFAGAFSFGLDVLFQSLDGLSLATYTVKSGESIIGSGALNIPNTGTGGSFFLGFRTNNPAELITSIVISDNDDDATNPDSNLGYDTLRLGGSVPEPSAWAMMIAGLGLAGGMLRRRRAART